MTLMVSVVVVMKLACFLLVRSAPCVFLSDPDHQLFPLIPERQSKSRRHSTRLKDSFLTGANTALRSKTFFMNACANFT